MRAYAMKEYKHNHMPSSDDILRKKLSNGITLLARENPFSQTVVIRASIPCGSYLDPMDKTGLADFVANCLNMGTFSHNFQQLSELLESSGASLGINCGPKAYTIQGTCLAEDLPMILGLMKELKFKETLLVGSSFCTYNENPDRKTFTKVEDLCQYLESHPISGKTILVKGSHSVQLEKVLPLL